MANVLKFSGYLCNKKELMGLFGARTDCQYVQIAYETWGEDCAAHLQGMFGFIIWDEKEGKTVCVRDRYGNESVYYYVTDTKEVVTGLSIREILADSRVKKEMNPQALELFLTFSYLPGQDTFFRGIHKVMPGHVVTFCKGKKTVTRYFKPEYRGNSEKSIDEYAKDINDTLGELIEDWKLPGEKYGNFLSGGVDSAYLSALTHPEYTFSTAYEDKDFDESPLAKITADYLGAKHVKVMITPKEYFDVIPEAMTAMEQPLGDASTIAFYLACKGAKKYVDVCYSGEGADELFCGYHAYTRRLVNLLNPDYVSAPVENYYIGNTKVMSEPEKKELLLHYSGEKTPLQLANSLYEFDENTDDITKMWLCDLQVWFEGDIMLNAEKMSKANALMARTPFLDSRLYEVACQVPSEYKVSCEETKIVFRKAAANRIPEEVAFRRKLGFAVPARVWMAQEPYRDNIRKVFEGKNAAKFFRKEVLEKMLSDEFLSKPDNWRKTWCVYVFLVWYDRYFED